MSAAAWSLIIALCWVVPFAIGGHVQLGRTRFSRRLLSAAGGSAIAYVFIDLLPEMQHMQERFLTAAAGRAFPFPNYRVYTSALLGFVLFYALEHAAVGSRPVETPGEGEPRERMTVFWLQAAGFATYVGMMAYLLREDAENRSLAMLPYGVAMFLHFWIVDHALRHEHGAPYARFGRWLLAGGIVVGWLLAAMEVGSELWLPTLMGFIAGGIVLNSVKGEMPEEGQARMVPFVAGAFGYALLLLMAG